jgi:hypothetical protein
LTSDEEQENEKKIIEMEEEDDTQPQPIKSKGRMQTHISDYQISLMI